MSAGNDGGHHGKRGAMKAGHAAPRVGPPRNYAGVHSDLGAVKVALQVRYNVSFQNEACRCKHMCICRFACTIVSST